MKVEKDIVHNLNGPRKCYTETRDIIEHSEGLGIDENGEIIISAYDVNRDLYRVRFAPEEVMQMAGLLLSSTEYIKNSYKRKINRENKKGNRKKTKRNTPRAVKAR